jgi:hypothetical protein
MKVTTLAEPLLEFGTGTHICPRTGIEHLGVYDKRTSCVGLNYGSGWSAAERA